MAVKWIIPLAAVGGAMAVNYYIFRRVRVAFPNLNPSRPKPERTPGRTVLFRPSSFASYKIMAPCHLSDTDSALVWPSPRSSHPGEPGQAPFHSLKLTLIITDLFQLRRFARRCGLSSRGDGSWSSCWRT